jgi:glyoxylase-like metal-dependent hydrolase (beta-lactamase superfamily II)
MRGSGRPVVLGLVLFVTPLGLGAALAMMAARGPHLETWLALGVVAALFVAACVTALRGAPRLLLAALPSTAALLLFLSTYLGSPIPAGPPITEPLPGASPPASMRIERLPTGIIHRSAAFAYSGGTMFDARDFAMTATLIRHPAGDVLVDTGLGKDIGARLEAFPLLFRAMTSYERGPSAAEQLEASGYDTHSLRGVILTHAHWDHASGVPELPDTPVLVTEEERRFVDEGGTVMAITRNLPDVRWETYAFEPRPYLGFSRSHDLYGDGSIVIVPVPGHTPGSILVFVALPSGERWALLGDLVWQLEGITERVERPWLTRGLADADPQGVRDGIAHVAAIHDAFPEMHLVPAHDGRGFAAMPELH